VDLSGPLRRDVRSGRKEIMCMLQRYIARELYPLIIDALRASATIGAPLAQLHAGGTG
jgi:hypothetical protein